MNGIITNNNSQLFSSSRENHHNQQKSPPPHISSIPKSAVKKWLTPTHCICLKNGHYPNLSLDTKLPGTVEKIYNLLFASDFVECYIIYEEKCMEVHIGE